MAELSEAHNLEKIKFTESIASTDMGYEPKVIHPHPHPKKKS